MLEIEMRPVDSVSEYAGNPRRNEDAIDYVAKSIQAYGFRQPIVVDSEGVIIAGHTRYRAAKQLGLVTVPVHVADLDEQQAKAYRIADNQTATRAGWDDELLAIELRALRDDEADLAPLGFTDDELTAALGVEEGLTEPDAIPDPPDEPTAVRGDVWLLGDHRVMCGDATSEEDVNRLLDGAEPFVMVTDPPYGVEYDPAWRETAVRRGKVTNDDRVDWSAAWRHFGGDVAYVWCSSLHLLEAAASLDENGFERRSLLIWAKPMPQMSRGHYHWQHEHCWYAVRKGAAARWQGGRSQSTVWKITPTNDPYRQNEEPVVDHPTQKPVECMARPIRNHGSAGDIVYDPFLGSGTTVIAAEMHGRRCYGLEIDPIYCDIILNRWEQFTGRKAKRLEG